MKKIDLSKFKIVRRQDGLYEINDVCLVKISNVLPSVTVPTPVAQGGEESVKFFSEVLVPLSLDGEALARAIVERSGDD